MIINFENKEEYMSVIKDKSNFIFYYGDPVNKEAWASWIESVRPSILKGRTRGEISDAAEKMNADFLVCSGSPSALCFRDQKSYVLFRLKYG